MKNKKNIVALLLAFVLIAGLLPAPVFAASSGGTGAANALSAIGIDASATPDDYDPNAKNPYGRQTTALNTVSELYSVGLSAITTTQLATSRGDKQKSVPVTVAQTLQGKLWGDNVWGESSAQTVFNATSADSDIASGTSEITGKYNVPQAVSTQVGYLDSLDVSTTLNNAGADSFNLALSVVAEGSFDGKKDGKTAQAVLLYTSKLSKNGGIFFSVGDIKDGNYGASKELVSTSETSIIGNPGAKIDGAAVENFDSDPYLLQNYLQAATGDFDGDGVDEIAVYIPEYGHSRIEVYKLVSKTGQGEKPYLDPDNWNLEWTYSLRETTYVSNMVSLLAGDFNKDGVDDLAATWGYYYGPEDNKGSTAVVMFGASSKMLQTSKEFPLKYGNADIVRGAFAYGDLGGAGEDVLVLGGQSNTDLANGNLYTRYVALYEWNGSDFVTNDNLCKNFDLFARDKDGNLVNGVMGNRTYNQFYSSPLCVSNLAVVRQGMGKNRQLYFDSLMIEYDSDAGLYITKTYDNTNRMQENPDAGCVPYVEYGAVSGDVIGVGEDTLVTMSQTLPTVTEHSLQEWKTDLVEYSFWVAKSYYSNWWNKLWGIKSYYYELETITIAAPRYVYETLGELTLGKTHQVSIYNSSQYNKKPVDVSTSLCMPNTDDDTTYLNYNAKHYFVYSDPNVLAVLASPPYFSDLLGRDDLSGNYAESTTSYSSTKGSGGTITAAATISAGVYVKVEQEFSVFGIKIGQAEAETAITGAFTYEYEHASNLEQTVTYSATSGEDMIALYSIPVEVFEFTASVPDGNGTYNDQIMTVNIPHTAAVKLISLDEYEMVAADYAGILPQISGSVLTHTVGDPASYPSSTSGYKKAVAYVGTPAAVGYSSTAGGSAISQEIAMTTETTHSFSASVAIETKVGAGAGGVTVGVTVGYEAGAGYAITSTSGSSFSGELQNMPIEAEPYGYYHNWRIFSYEYNDGKLQFPVVSYLVNDVSAPPPLPEDFTQDTSDTTSDQIALTWSYSASKTIAGFQLYRYYEFPSGSGSYELAFVPYSAGVYDADTGLMNFEYIDAGLNPYTEYKYQIQSVRAAAPIKSIYSEAMSARTKTDRGYPQITLSGLTGGGTLPIYPDTPSSVTVSAKDADGKALTSVTYQWQKYSGSKWNDIGGQISDKLTFSASGAADEALYRCRINTIYYDDIAAQTYYISAYSDVFATKYYKRNATVAEGGFTALPLTGNGLTLSLELLSADGNHGAAPEGEVTFTVTGTDYKNSFTEELKANTSPDGNGKYHSTATYTINNLPEGVYEITAFYGGSRIFKTYTCEETQTVLIGNATGYQLTLSSGRAKATSFTYGDTISAVLELVEKEGSSTKLTPITEGVTFTLVDGSSSSDVIASFGTPNRGSYTLEARLNDELVAERAFTVAPRRITVEMESHTEGAGEVEDYPPENCIKLSADTPMAPGEELADLKLTYIATNSANNITVMDNTTLPGNYTVTPCESGIYDNYEITFIPGVYTVVGQTYAVTYGAELLGGITAGTVSLTNTSANNKFSASTELLFVASPYRGYAVDTWTVTAGGKTAATQTGKNQFSYTMLSEDIRVTVTFKRQPVPLTTIVQGGGEITCDNIYFKSGDLVNLNAEMTFTATPKIGYHFVRWLLYDENNPSGGEYLGTPASGGGSELSVTMGSVNTTLYAEFARDSYTLTLSGDLEAAYTYKDAQSQDVESVVGNGASITGDTVVTVRPKTGYQVAPDAVWTIKGAENTTSAGDQEFVFTILADTSVSVGTDNLTYTVGVSCDGREGGAVFAVNGGEAQSGVATGIAGGSRVVLTATPLHGYVFKSWTVNEEENYSTDRVLTISQLGRDIDAVAVFEPNDSYTASIALSAPHAAIGYTLKDALENVVCENEPYPAGGITVYKGDTLTVAISPDIGFMVRKWTVNGEIKDISSNKYTFAAISGNITVQVDIEPISYKTVKYSVDDSSDSYGTISATSDGVGFASGVEVGGGTTVVFTAVPEDGYMVEKWTANDEVVLNEYGVPLVDNEYIIDGLGTNVDVVAYFADVVIYTFDVAATNASYEAAFEPAFGTNGDELRDGAAAIFTFTPDAGYTLTEAKVNGADFDSVTKRDDGTWVCTVYSVTDDLTVTATAKSSDASLSALSVEDVSLNETFEPYRYDYTANVPNGTTKVTVNAEANDPNAGGVSISGADSLAVGKNTIKIVVTAEDGVTTETYTITVTRASAGSMGGDGGGGTGGGEDTDETVSITINGKSAPATVDENGVLEIIYSESDIREYLDDTSEYDIYISEYASIIIEIPISALGDDNLTIRTDFGVITIPNSALQALREAYGNTLRLMIVKGSFRVALLNAAGQEIAYNDPDHPFTVTLPYTLGIGRDPGVVVAVGADSSILPFGIYKNGSISFKITETGTYNVIYNKIDFTDIAEHWAEDYIDFVAARAMYSGVGNGQFNPDGSMTRAMFAQVLANLDGADLSGYTKSRFSDVPEGQWYTAAVEWAADKDIVSGVGGGMFDPNASITREQMAVMLLNYIQYKDYDIPAGTSAEFADETEISSWAAEAVKVIQEAGIVNGKPGNLFDPRGTATRAEVATVFARFVEFAAA